MNSISPKITIAIPTYNRLEYLKESVQSILNQTYQNFEIIIFDDKSEYPIEEFLSFFKDQRITFLRSDTKLANNRENFKRIYNYPYLTEFLVIFHDDDTMRPDFLEKKLNILKKIPTAVFVGSLMNFVHDNKKMKIFKYKNKPNIIICNSPLELLKLFLKNINLCFDSIMYRIKFLENPEKFYKNFLKWNDRPFLLHLAKKGPTIIFNDKMVNYRIHADQDSKQISKNELNYLLNLLIYYKNFLTKPITRPYKKLFFTFSTNNLIMTGLNYSNSLREYKKFIKNMQKKGFIKLKYINLRGIYYLIKVLIHY